MHKNTFYKFGKLIYPLRWWLIILWIVVILGCIPFLPHIISPFKTTGFVDRHSVSTSTQRYIDKQLGFNHENQFIILYSSRTLKATDSSFIDKIKDSLSNLKHFSIKHEIIYPDENKKQISEDKHTAYAVVIVKSKKQLTDELLKEFRSLIKTPSHMTLEFGGEPFFIEKVNKQTQIDLYKADFVATPVALITLIFVFGSVVAAMIPILLGGGCALIILTSLYFIGHVCTLSIFTLNIALLLGLCLSLDYSLFIVCRFSDEIRNKHSVKEAVAITQGTAGKAIFFSGIAVFVSLSALFLFPVNILFSMAVGGLVAVFVSVLHATLLLPAILSVLGENIHLLSVRTKKQRHSTKSTAWHWIAEKVVGHPLYFFFPILILLLLLGYPFLSVKLGVSDYRILPEQSQARQFYDKYGEQFDENQLMPISMLVLSHKHNILSKNNLDKIYNLASKLQLNSSIEEVDSIVTTEPRLTKTEYYHLYHMDKKVMPKSVKQLLDTTTRENFTVLSIISKYKMNSDKTKALIHTLEKTYVEHGLYLMLTGTPVSNLDVVHAIQKRLLYAILWIMVFTYLILLVLLRSLILPIKAIIMTLISLSACYGALVLVFQNGYLHHLFNFETQNMLDVSLLVIIFCALFGFSMDYEVFLLTRIKESYDVYKNVKKSIVFGIEKSSRIITSAALIVIVLCGSFFVADVLMVKAFGLGISVAIFVDAFLIRTILVPSTMTLLKEWNWYLPRWMDKIIPKL